MFTLYNFPLVQSISYTQGKQDRNQRSRDSRRRGSLDLRGGERGQTQTARGAAAVSLDSPGLAHAGAAGILAAAGPGRAESSALVRHPLSLRVASISDAPLSH